MAYDANGKIAVILTRMDLAIIREALHQRHKDLDVDKMPQSHQDEYKHATDRINSAYDKIEKKQRSTIYSNYLFWHNK